MANFKYTIWWKKRSDCFYSIQVHEKKSNWEGGGDNPAPVPFEQKL